MTSEIILPCHCGYEGALPVEIESAWYEATCPACERVVKAFTTKGLIENWNKPEESPCKTSNTSTE